MASLGAGCVLLQSRAGPSLPALTPKVSLSARDYALPYRDVRDRQSIHQSSVGDSCDNALAENMRSTTAIAAVVLMSPLLPCGRDAFGLGSPRIA